MEVLNKKIITYLIVSIWHLPSIKMNYTREELISIILIHNHFFFLLSVICVIFLYVLYVLFSGIVLNTLFKHLYILKFIPPSIGII